MKSAGDLTSPQNDVNASEDSSREESPYGYEFGDYWLNPNAPSPKLRLFYRGKERWLPNLPFNLLRILVESGGAVVSSEDLMRLLWPTDKIDDTNRHLYRGRLDHVVPRVREVFDDKNAILNQDNGYRITLPVTRSPLTKPPPDAITDYSFLEWLSSPDSKKVKLFLAGGVGFSVLYLLAKLLVQHPVVDRLPASAGLSFIQFVVVLGALLASKSVFRKGGKKFPASKTKDLALMKRSGYTDKTKWSEVKAAALISLDKYVRYWRLLLVSWCGLYVLLTFVLVLKTYNVTGTVLLVSSIVTTAFNNCNSVAIALCFVVLHYPTVVSNTDQNTTGEDNNNAAAPPATTLLHIMKVSERVAGVVIIAIAVTEFLLALRPGVIFGTPDNVIRAFDLGSGFIGGITLALFVGRIQSRFLGPSIWLPLALYLYVVMQARFVTIKEYAGWAPAIIEAALALKCVLYLYIAWLFKSGRLLFYLVRVKKIYETVNIEWQNFLFNLDS